MHIVLDKAVYSIFMQFLRPKNSIKLILVRTKMQYKSLILSSDFFFIVYDPIVFSLRLSFLHTTKAIVGYKFIHRMGLLLVY